MKKEVLIYSDCFTFGGSEYVAINILKSPLIQSVFNLHFAYREHKEYSYYVNKLLSKEKCLKLHPLKLWSNDTLFHTINTKVRNRHLRYIIKLPMWLVAHIGPYKWNNKYVFRKLLSEINVDLIHINNGGYPAAETCLYLALCASELGIKNIFQVNNQATPMIKNRRDIKVEKSVNLFLTATECARKELSLNRHFDINKISTLFNAVEDPIPFRSKDEVRRELGITQDDFIITEVALLEKRKGQIPLLKAMLELKNLNESLYNITTILFVGNGEDERKICEFIESHGLEKKVKMLGYRLEYIDIVNASDVFALPSLFNEDMPLSILTAMALSKPILSSKLAGIPEEVEDNINGCLADPLSPSFVSDIACLIEKIYNNKEAYGKASLIRYKSLFCREIYENKLIKLYNSIIYEDE